MSANQGVALAQRNLAKLYEKGYGVKQSIDQAIKYYRLAAEQGDEYAKAALKRLEK